jgi:hypothetical protein
MARRYDNLFITMPMEHGAPFGDEHALYSEYVLDLLNIPTLRDEVAAPRPVLLADFRQGQRPNVRKASRDDPFALREERASDLESIYAEFSDGVAGPTIAAAPTKKKRRAKPKGASAPRGPARKRSGRARNTPTT